jgi:hypothetical protein
VKYSACAECEIKFVPSHATGVFHSFRKERISLKKAKSKFDLAFFLAHPYKIDPQSKFFEIDPRFSVGG